MREAEPERTCFRRRLRAARLIIELDGRQHADNEHDRVREARLSAQGDRVLRFWNADAATNFAGVVDTILAALPPSPRLQGDGSSAASPKGEGEEAAPVESHSEPPPHPRLPPRCDDEVVASLSPHPGRGEIQT
ncbi:DUF559 domain-containing protein [Methylobacterium sp. P1-11]|uniref:endonuclease domain-containing protein n=1 Tax=Methylobacterium sp. P1-11 TaxID=2024616 RepID=UPI0011EEC9EF|nr:DUF559 domain-containing protein [Methylobacterium sp. P1-11]KAA0123763.1 DUF559 domain-containing protein [Methylobacterium sp. P1-11]